MTIISQAQYEFMLHLAYRDGNMMLYCMNKINYCSYFIGPMLSEVWKYCLILYERKLQVVYFFF